jgi:hypothetical protein
MHRAIDRRQVRRGSDVIEDLCLRLCERLPITLLAGGLAYVHPS